MPGRRGRLRATARSGLPSLGWPRTPARRLLFGKWASAGRLIPGMLIVPLMIAFNDEEVYGAGWASLLVLLVFMFSVSLAAVSLGVVMFVWFGLVGVARVWGRGASCFLARRERVICSGRMGGLAGGSGWVVEKGFFLPRFKRLVAGWFWCASAA